MNPRLTTTQWNRIEEVFDAVLQYPEQQRPAALEELTKGEPQLRAEVASLLRHDRDEALPAVMTGNTVNIQPQRTPGEIVAGYRLLFPLSIQTSGEVWCAEPVDDTAAERVAIKFLGGDLTNERRLRRFEQEARLLAGFRHPNIAEFLNCGRDDAGTPFIVMRFVAGKPLTVFANEKRLSIDERLRLMNRVCEAVGYAHRFLVVHRDLKPDNILVTADGSPVVLDFGISKELGTKTDGNELALQLTATQDRPMTPAFAAPEQIRGEAVTTATDVYSLGLTLYELLSGHHAYSDAAQPNARHLFDRICEAVPRKPSDVVTQSTRPLGQTDDSASDTPRLVAALRGLSTGQLKRRLVGAVDSVVMQAIAKSPESRYPAVADLSNDLVNLLERRPVSARVDRDRLGRAIRRRPYTAIVAAALLAGFIATGITVLWRRGTEAKLNGKLELANDATVQAKSEARLAEDQRALAEQQVQQVRQSVMLTLGRDPSASVTAAEAVAALAREAASRGDVQQTTRLLGDIKPAADLSIQASIDRASALQILGRPTAGLAALANWPPTEDAVANIAASGIDPDAFSEVIIRLLLDAARTSEIEAWRKLKMGVAVSQAIPYELIRAEMRCRIGWPEGAAQSLDDLESRSSQLSAAQANQLKLVRARIAEDVPADLFQPRTNSLADITIAADARLLAAEFAFNAGNTAAATERLVSVVKMMEDANFPQHRTILQALSMQVAVAEREENWTAAIERAQTCWHRAEDAGEQGTLFAIKAAISLMRGKDADRAYAILDQLRPHAAAYQSDPYLHRSILIPESEAALTKQDWPHALASAGQLVDYELKMWGTNSLEHAWALAALGAAQHGSKQPTAATSFERVQAIVRNIQISPSPAAAFIAPARAFDPSASAKRLDQWIDLYTQHRANESDAQLEMLTYVIEQQQQPTSDVISVVQAAAAFLDGSLDSPNVNNKTLRIGWKAAEFKQISAFQLRLSELANSSDANIADGATACLVHGFAVTGQYDAAFAAASEYIGGEPTETGQLREAVSELMKTLPANETPDRWLPLIQ